ncbi:MAG: 2-oxoacid:acceptor oxidoreductase family protein [Dehalococcoidia bacterium]
MPDATPGPASAVRHEIRLTGFGGQGIISAGYTLALAAALYEDGVDAVMTRAYGPEKTGGWARADVVISPGDVDYPQVTAPDAFIALSQEGFDRDAPSARAGAVMYIDADLVDPGEGAKGVIHRVPATGAAEALGRRVVANNVMLGAFTRLSGLVSVAAMERAVAERAPKGTEELNLAAFRRGTELAEETQRGAQ